MKKIAYIFLGFAICMNLVSCQTPSQKFLNEYRVFAENFILSHESYTATDWEVAAAEYSSLRDQYGLYRMDLTLEERSYIDAINAKINAAFIRHKGTNAASEIESLFKETIGTINELLEN